MSAVYFLKAVSSGWIKIGYSKRPLERVSGYHTFCPHELRLLKVIEGERDVEHAWHRRFAPPIPGMRSACSKGHQRESCAVTACERWRIVPAGMTPARGRSSRGAGS